MTTTREESKSFCGNNISIRSCARMKVLYIKSGVDTKDYFGGSSQSLLNLFEALKHSSPEVEPIVLFASKGKVYDRFVESGIQCYVHRFESITINRLSLKHLLLHPWRAHFARWLRYDLPCILYARKIIRENNIEIIHTNDYNSSLGRSLQRVLKVKHVWHIRSFAGIGRINIEFAGGRKRHKRRIDAADARIVISSKCKEAWGFKNENTYVLLNAVRSVDDCCHIKEKQPYILFCAYDITLEKGALAAVCAYGLSKLAGSGIRLRFVGNVTDPIRQDILSKAREYDCAGEIDFLPVQDDIKPQYAHATAYLNPSVNEGMGRTTAEAMFFGCPVVAHASGGALDLIRHGQTGYLFHNVEECASLLREVCTNGQDKIIEAAQDFARQNLSIENYGDKILAVYGKLLRE